MARSIGSRKDGGAAVAWNILIYQQPWRKLMMFATVVILAFAVRDFSGMAGFSATISSKAFKLKNETLSVDHVDEHEVNISPVSEPIRAPPALSTKMLYEGIEIEREPATTNAPDILQIRHIPDNDQLKISFAYKGRCLRPHLRARLSGPALVMLEDWQWQEGTNGTGPIMTGSYHAPIGGTFFLEVLMIYCHDFLYHMSEVEMDQPIRTKQINYNFIKACVEDPWSNRLTKSGVTIEITNSTTTISNLQLSPGFWWNKNPDSSQQIPMMTRFQTRRCRENPNQTGCPEVLSLERFNNYEFRWSPLIAPKMTTDNLRQNNLFRVCLIGQSHSRKLFEAAVRMNLRDLINIEVLYPCKAQYPWHINSEFLAKCILPHNCHKIVVALGQWAASFQERHPTPVGDFYQQMYEMLIKMRDDLPKDEVEIIARSIHYNPINNINSACPPYDWRTPLVIDSYNKIIQKAVKDAGAKHQNNITYLDTNFLIGPIWDSGFDWCHLPNETSEIEMFYIAAVASGAVDSQTVF